MMSIKELKLKSIYLYIGFQNNHPNETIYYLSHPPFTYMSSPPTKMLNINDIFIVLEKRKFSVLNINDIAYKILLGEEIYHVYNVENFTVKEL